MSVLAGREIQMSTTSWATPTAPLSDEEILQRYSGVLWEGMAAFAADPVYAAEMVEAAALITYKQALYTVRARLQASGMFGAELKAAVWEETTPLRPPGVRQR